MNNRLYRSTSDLMLGGVAAGIARYLNIDPIIVRVAFVLGTLMTDWLFFIYLALWLILPAPGSTANDLGATVRENVNEFTSRLRPEQANAANTTNPQTGIQASTQVRQGLSSSTFAWILILIGGFFLANALHITNWHMWGLFWPALIIGAGFYLLRRPRS